MVDLTKSLQKKFASIGFRLVNAQLASFKRKSHLFLLAFGPSAFLFRPIVPSSSPRSARLSSPQQSSLQVALEQLLEQLLEEQLLEEQLEKLLEQLSEEQLLEEQLLEQLSEQLLEEQMLEQLSEQLLEEQLLEQLVQMSRELVSPRCTAARQDHSTPRSLVLGPHSLRRDKLPL